MRLKDFGLGSVCRCCGGSGKSLDHADVGKWMKGYRQRKGLTLKQASSPSGVSIQYLNDLEQGRRNWNEDLFNRVKGSIDNQ